MKMLASLESHRFGVVYILLGKPNKVKFSKVKCKHFFDSVALLRQIL